MSPLPPFFPKSKSEPMKKKYLALACIMACFFIQIVYSQSYFQHMYGNVAVNGVDFETGYDGHRTVNNLDGHMISGTSQLFSNYTITNISFAVSDADGNLTTSCFANFYSLMDANSNRLVPANAFCVEVNTSDYALAGAAGPLNQLNDCVFFALIDGTGNVTSSKTFSLGPNFGAYNVNEMVADPSGSYVYIVGDVDDYNTSSRNLFVLKLQSNGSIQWGVVYNVSFPNTFWCLGMDGVEVPGGQEFTIVGHAYDYFGTPTSFLFALDATTGAPSGTPLMLPFDNTDPYMATCIDWSPDPTLPSGGGYIVGGIIYPAPTPLYFYGSPTAFLIDYDFTNPWFIANSYESVNDPNPTSYTVRDVQFRMIDPSDPARAYSYWMTGPYLGGYYGRNSTEVWRLDRSLNGVTQLVYENGVSGFVAAIDMGKYPDPLAVTVFGATTMAPAGVDQNLWISRSYLSGHLPTGCDWYADEVNTRSNLDLGTDSYPSPEIESFGETNGTVSLDDPMYDYQMCQDVSVTGGSNDKTANIVTANTKITLLRNSLDAYSLAFSPATEKAGTLELSLHDMSGHQLRSMNPMLASGTSAFDLKDWFAGLASGAYVLRWTYGDLRGAQQLIFNRS